MQLGQRRPRLCYSPTHAAAAGRPLLLPAVSKRTTHASNFAAAADHVDTSTSDNFSSTVSLEPALYIVGTPIGNLEDMTYRALRTLRSVNLVLAEDTRHTRKLLEYFGIKTNTLSFHQHNEKQRENLVMQRLQQGEPIALVCDAGMPAISDPGTLLVGAAVAAGVKVVPIPGPCAAITALAASGLPTDSFHFIGFLPPKSSKRCASLEQVQHIPATLLFYVPPHGLAAILADMIQVLGGTRRAVLARELTKVHEEFCRGTLTHLLDEYGPEGRRGGVVKGELVLLVDGFTDPAGSSASVAAAGQLSDESLRQMIKQELLAGSTVSATAKQLSKQLRVSRSTIYKVALMIEQQLKQHQL